MRAQQRKGLPVYRGTLSPHPDGWYCIALSSELRTGIILTRTFMDREIILFRTASGSAVASSAYCPHLGAHLGQGGEIRGETVRCQFHGFCFDASGECTETGYGTKVPARARLRMYPVLERAGFVIAWFDNEDRPPAWTPPELDTRGWSPTLSRLFDLRGHPQETSENSVDIKHFEVVHGYRDVQELRPAVPDGPYLSARYGMKRRSPFGSSRPVRIEFDVHVHGLGYSVVDVEMVDMGLRSRQFVLATPTTGERIDLRIGLSLRNIERPARVHPLLALAPAPLVTWLIARVAMNGYAHDVRQDFAIWRHKEYVARPALAVGDGPIGTYRRWAQQFYPDLQSNEASAA